MSSQFQRLVATLDYPVYIVTTASEDGMSGCLIGFATQCSIHPPRFLACISKKNHTFLAACRADVVAVHVVDESNRDVAALFGGETGDEIDKFSRVRWHMSQGVPILDNCQNWFVGAKLEQFDFGDHVGLLLEPTEAEHADDSEPLTFQQARDIHPGHKP